ncbi:MAG: Flp pilus assembly protein CpaB [Blastocatellia bacterium]
MKRTQSYRPTAGPHCHHENFGARTNYGFAAGSGGSSRRTIGGHPGGYRAMTVRVDDETGIAGFLVPGTLVDVLAVISANNGNPVSKIVLQNIKVLANGQNLDQPKDEREANSVKTVTLQVTPDQSEKLALAAAEGKLRLALRNSVDKNDEATSGATRRSLLTGERSALLEAEPKTPQPPPIFRPAPTPSKPAPNRAPVRNTTPVPLAPTLPAPEPAKPRPAVEVFEGSKKRTVVFP